MTGWFMNGFKKFAVGLGVMACGSAWAQGEALIAGGELDKVAAILAQQQRNLADGCGAVSITKATALLIDAPLVLDETGKPQSGKWRVRYAVEACGKAGLRMVEMTVVGGKGVAIEALAPGETLADAKLQGDVTRSFGMAGRVAMPGCEADPVVRNTTLRVRPATGTDKWQELWVGRMCGRDMAQAVEFLPTKAGTTFKMSLPVAGKK